MLTQEDSYLSCDLIESDDAPETMVLVVSIYEE